MMISPLPTHWMDREGRQRKIVDRAPYFMGATQVVTAATAGTPFAEGSFTHNVALPFEVLKFVPRVTTLDSNAAIQSDPEGARIAGDELFRWVKLNIKGIGRDRAFTKSSTLLSTMVDYNDYAVKFAQPWNLVSGEGFDVIVDNNLTSARAAGGIRMELCFHGNLLIVE